MMNAISKRGYSGLDRMDTDGKLFKSTKNGKTFVVKVVALAVEKDDLLKMDEVLQTELSVALILKHSNCITIHNMFRTQTHLYTVLDYVPNGNIDYVVQQGGPLCESNIKIWFQAIVCAIEYLHKHNIAHKDLKLTNVLLDAHLNPIVTNFGYSRFVDVDQSVDWSHQPPEIIKQLPNNPFRCDIWCLGVALFIMANQIYPFGKKEPKDLMYSRQMAKDYQLQPSVDSKISHNLKSLIRSLLEPIAAERPTIGRVFKHDWFPVVFQQSQWK